LGLHLDRGSQSSIKVKLYYIPFKGQGGKEMSIKKKAAMGMASIAFGAMSVMGGTFAYFSDTTEASSQFTNGTLNLQPEKPWLESFQITHFKPGDKLIADSDNQEPAMVLNNQGNLPMNVFMKVDTSSVKGTADHIMVNKLEYGTTNLLTPAMDTSGDGRVSLTEVGNYFEGNTTLNGNTINGVGKYLGFLDAPDSDPATWGHIKSVKYELEFKDNGADQNALQGDVTNIDFVFTGLQYEGKVLDSNNLVNDPSDSKSEYKRNDNINDREGTKNDK
jgi:spore coat-associated protein N